MPLIRFCGDAKPKPRIILVPHVEPTGSRRLQCARGSVGQREAAEHTPADDAETWAEEISHDI